jgi:hypothetical protein
LRAAAGRARLTAIKAPGRRPPLDRRTHATLRQRHLDRARDPWPDLPQVAQKQGSSPPMNRRRTPLLLVALSALFSPLPPAALAQPGGSPPEAAPRADPAPRPAVAAGPLETRLGELTARVQLLGQGAEAAAQVAEDLAMVGQRLVESQRTLAAHAAALNEGLVAAAERVEAAQAVGAENDDLIVRLRTELEATRAEARALAERLEASRQGLEALRALLGAPAAPGDAAGGEGKPK